MEYPEFKDRLAHYKNNSVVFLLCPQKSILVLDGVRKQSTFEELEQITDIYRKIFKEYGIRYCEIKELDKREQIVLAYLKNLKDIQC